MSARLLLGLGAGAGALVTVGVVAAAERRRLVSRATDAEHRAVTAERRTLTDPLTGLANRNGLHEGLAHISAAHRSYVLLMIDLDRFKPVNDSYGHDAGDLVLIAVGRRLVDLVDADAVVARLGGDEFAIAAPARSALVSGGLGHDVVAALRRPFIAAGREIRIGASVGVVHAATAESVRAVLHTADAAMYRAKTAGGDRMVEHDPASPLLTPGTTAPATRLRDMHDLARATSEVAA